MTQGARDERLRLIDRTQQSVTRLFRNPGVVAAIAIDLDRSALADLAGVGRLDEAARRVYSHAAARIDRVSRDTDTVARVSEHQLVILAEVRVASDLRVVNDRIERTLEEPFLLDNGKVIGIRIGVGAAHTAVATVDASELVTAALASARTALVDHTSPDSVNMSGDEPGPLGAAPEQSRAVGGVALTGREHETLARMCDGQGTKKMAESMGISVTTVRTHVRAVLSKLDVHSRVEAVALAARTGMVAGLRR